MIVLLDTSEALDVCAMELGMERNSVKQLLTPLTSFLRQKEHDEFAIDNGFFAGGTIAGLKSLLERERQAMHLCKFVTVPDVVGSARRTCELFHELHYEFGNWPLAFVAQDGIEDLPIPWKQIRAVFIGGTTQFKLGDKAKAVIRAAQALGKWVHVGRVNTPERFDKFFALGVDSIDGTGISRYSHMRKDLCKLSHQPNLWTGHAPSVAESSRLEATMPLIAETASGIIAESGDGTVTDSAGTKAGLRSTSEIVNAERT